MMLEDKDILQVDAAVTTGLLIFLTISFFGTPTSDNEAPASNNGTATSTSFEFISLDLSFRLLFTTAALSPFVVSATMVLARVINSTFWKTEQIRR
jgi:hypothetical protein